ncbi:hypothetical protein LCGC14_1760180 [marine sediment metagenome]|uniref:YkgJ family cysteine cluster protein n=1 Tax=marine sediment metagenome TaxID=412755 RepID=A0A0F9JGE4_9ZZZZ
MPLVESPVSCAGCGACCINLSIEAEGGDPPAEMVTERQGKRVMKQREDHACVALDPKTRHCTIYEWRPDICRQFGPEDEQCLDALNRLQQKVMNECEEELEAILRETAILVLKYGYAPFVRTVADGGPQDIQVFLRRRLHAPDVRSGQLAAAVTEFIGQVNSHTEELPE